MEVEFIPGGFESGGGECGGGEQPYWRDLRLET